MRIAVVGAGSVGKTLGGAKNYDIVYWVRDPAKIRLRNAMSWP
jgi:ketopantoate reductase